MTIHTSQISVQHSTAPDQIQEELHCNPYFPEGAIPMPKMLNDGAVEYEEATSATEAQMGKDVVTFLSWAAEPEMEERKLLHSQHQMKFSQPLGAQQFQSRQLSSGPIQHGIGQSQLNQRNKMNRLLNQFPSSANSALFNAAQATPSTQMLYEK